jgi:hypothetical protein
MSTAGPGRLDADGFVTLIIDLTPTSTWWQDALLRR